MVRAFFVWAARNLAVIACCIEFDRVYDIRTLQLPVAMLLMLCIVALIPKRGVVWER